MLRLLITSAVVSATVIGVARSAPVEAYVYDRQLGLVARASLSQAAPRGTLKDVLRVYVRCYRDKHAFESTYERRSGESARWVVAYYAGRGDVHLRNGTCAGVHEFFEGRRTVYTAGALSVLLHEALHRQGLRNERTTTSRLFAPRAYRMGKPDCLALARHKDWPAFT